jgi:hypothetical protein
MSYLEEALNESMGRLGSVSAKNSTSDKSDPTFTCFSKLHIELRMKIWEHARFPRVIKFNSKTIGFGRFGRCDLSVVAAKTPAILQVNYESRQVALGFYELSFKHIRDKRPVYIDYRVDAVYMASWHVLEDMYISARERGCWAESDIHGMESKLRCLVLGYLHQNDELKSPMISRFRNIRSIIRHFRCPQLTISWPESRQDCLMRARATKKFAGDVLQDWKKKFGESAELPEVLFARDQNYDVKIQSWEVKTLSPIELFG